MSAPRHPSPQPACEIRAGGETLESKLVREYWERHFHGRDKALDRIRMQVFISVILASISILVATFNILLIIARIAARS